MAAVNSYSESSRLLSYYTGTKWDEASSVFKGEGKAVSKTVASDVKTVYVNTDDEEDGAETGISAFHDDTGYANIVFHVDGDGLVDVIIVETSDEKMKVGGTNAENFGKKDSGSTTTHTHSYTWTLDSGNNKHTGVCGATDGTCDAKNIEHTVPTAAADKVAGCTECDKLTSLT